jgi:hypothetical protein
LSGAPLLLQIYLNQVVASVMAARTEFAEELETVPTLIAIEVDAIALVFCICLAACLSVVLCPRDRHRERTTICWVSDIRSPLVLLFPLAPIFLGFALIGLAANSKAFTTPAQQQFIPAVPWIPYVIPSLLILLFLSVELCVWCVCRLSPRHWATGVPAEVAEGADVLVRSTKIWFMYTMLSVATGTYLFSQNLLIPRIFSAHYLPLAWVLAVGVLPLLWMLVYSWLSYLTHMGQLGGRLTGWWWQQRVTPSQATG